MEERFRSEPQQEVGGGRRKEDQSQSLSRSEQIAGLSGIFPEDAKFTARFLSAWEEHVSPGLASPRSSSNRSCVYE